MADSILGLIFEINADPSKAADALQRFEQSTGKSFEKAASGTKPLDMALLSNRESVRLLSEEIGIHMPRAVSGALAEMLPGINAIGPALLGAFAIAEIPKFIDGVKSAAEVLGGYTEAVRKAEKADIDASTSALIHFTTIAQGIILIAQTNQALANLAAKQGEWKEQAKAANAAMSDSKSVLAALLGPIGSAITLYRGYKAAVKESSDTESQAAELRQRLVAQLEQMTHLQDEAQKERAKTAKEAEQAQEQAERLAERNAERRAATEHRTAMERIRTMQEAGKEVEKLRNAEEQEAATKDRMAKAELDFALRLEEYGIVEQRQIQGFDKLIPQVTIATNATVHLGAARKELIWITQSAREAQEQWVAGLKDEIQAVQGDLMGNVQAFTQGLTGLIAGRKAQAGVEAIWETARGIALLAEGTWPPNPAALIAAGMHFEAAAQYALLAGSGGGHRGASGAGGGSYRSGVEHGGYGSDRSGYGMPPQTLALGASSAGGRFGSPGSGVIVVHGSTDLHQWVAGLVNGAVDRGITVTATSSQRGAPVGH